MLKLAAPIIVLLSTILCAQSGAPSSIANAAGQQPYQVGNGVSKPSLMFRTTCDVPKLAEKVRAQGDVTLSFVVKVNGSVSNVQIVRTVGYGIDEAVAHCIGKWRFRPGAKEGTPVEVAITFEYAFRLAPNDRLWGAGPIRFALNPGVKSPELKTGALPTSAQEPGDEAILFRFTVDPSGKVTDVQPVQAADSPSLALLTKSLSSWSFSPASDSVGARVATGEILFIKGRDYFRYKVSKTFRDSGEIGSAQRSDADAAVGPRSVVTVSVPITIQLDPDEAKKDLINQVPPQYPDAAKAAGVEGTVSLLVKISKDGSVADVQEISGPRELVPAAMAAVRQWRYRPILANEKPQQATTTVEIQFKLPR